jgi:2-succinyl-6-hydroxy-2,4-cyclohexadiene-1-carboxylate synthase
MTGNSQQGDVVADDLSINGVTYHAARYGKKQAMPLLLLHGFTGSGDSWTDLIPLFSSRYLVVTVDILGHGRSACPLNSNRYALPAIAADLIALLNAWQIGRTALLGYSMGGRLALYLACHYAERFSHLILESSSPGLHSKAERAERRQNDNALADWIEAKGIETFVTRWEGLPLWRSQQQLHEEIRQRLHQQRLLNSPVGLANSLRGMGTGAQPSLWHKLPALIVPTLLLAGELDTKFVAINQNMAARLGNGRLQLIPNAGHTTHLEQPDEFYTAVTNFLA